MNFMTAGDKNFFNTILFSVNQVKKLYPEARFYVYDWGFLSQQVEQLAYQNNVILVDWKNRFTDVKSVEIVDWKNRFTDVKSVEIVDWKNRFRKLIKKYVFFNKHMWKNTEEKISQHIYQEYLFCQKPYILLDCVSRCQEQLVYLDGDAFLVNSIDEIFEDNFNIGVTLRRKNEIKNKKNQCQVLNAGVIFLNGPHEKNVAFLNKWILTMHSTYEYLIEQTALTRMIEKHNPGIFSNYFNVGTMNIEGMRIAVKILPCEIYNYNWIEEGIDRNENKIVHFKGERHSERRFVKLIHGFDL